MIQKYMHVLELKLCTYLFVCILYDTKIIFYMINYIFNRAIRKLAIERINKRIIIIPEDQIAAERIIGRTVVF